MAGLTEETIAPGGIFCNADLHNGKSPSAEDAGTSPLCPQCGNSKKVWRDGNRLSTFGDAIQRWLCRDCGLRFSDPNDVLKAKKAVESIETVDTKSLKSNQDIVTTRQICVKETKNLEAEQQAIEVLRKNETGEFKQKILEYALWLKNGGKSEATIFGRVKLLKRLTKRGANLYDPESLKKTIAEQKWSNGMRNNAVDAYSSFLKWSEENGNRHYTKLSAKFPSYPKKQK